MNGLGCMYDQESVQMERVAADILLTQADLLPRRHMYRQSEVSIKPHLEAPAVKPR